MEIFKNAYCVKMENGPCLNVDRKDPIKYLKIKEKG